MAKVTVKAVEVTAGLALPQDAVIEVKSNKNKN